MSKAKRYDTVVLLEPIKPFQKGEKGAIVEVYGSPFEAYDVEIVTDDGRTKGLAEAVRPNQLEVVETARANITAFVAQQEVTRFVISKIGNQLCGDTPQLHIGERLCWSVPVILTSPANGVVGRVGEIIVDANTGELLVEADTVERIIARCELLAQRSPL